jgi:hypothetical protein
LGNPPFSVQENAKPLLACIMVLLVWIAYWASFMFGPYIYAELALPGILLLAATSLLLLLFFVSNAAPELKDPNHPDLGNKPAPINNIRYLIAYLMGVVLIAIAAAFYNAAEGRCFVELKLVEQNTASGVRTPKQGIADWVMRELNDGNAVDAPLLAQPRSCRGSRQQM